MHAPLRFRDSVVAVSGSERGSDDLTLDARARTSDGARREPPDDVLALPTKIGRFEILGRLGAGGMGEVLTAYDDGLDRRVAVKVVHQGDAGTRARGRMLREAQALAKVSHPNVVAVHEVGEHDGDLYIAMELIRGETLAEWTSDERPWQQVVDIFVQAAEGLAAAHAAGLIHRDFKPANAIVGEDGRVRVLDFGLARRAELDARDDEVDEKELGSADTLPATSARLTQTGVAAGTPAYMAPEQMTHYPLSPATDQFSFCVSLWEALYRERPFAGNAQIELFSNVIQGQRRDPPEASEVPDNVRDALIRGLHVDPAERWPSMDALAEALCPPAEATAARRRRLMVGFAVAAVIGGAAGGFAWARQLSAGTCPEGRERVAAVWNGDRANDLETRFADAQPYVQQTWTSVRGRAEAYADAWTSRWDRACAAALRDDGSAPSSPALACLERRLDELDASLELSASADASRWAFSMLLRPLASDLDDCESARASIADADRPESHLEEAAALDAELARISVRTTTNDPLEGVEQLPPVVERARALGDARVLTDALLAHASLLSMVGRHDEAKTLVEEAVLLAETNRYDRAAAGGLLRMLTLLRLGNRDLAAARALVPRVEAAVVRAGDLVSHRVALLHAQSFLAQEAGDTERALAHADHAIALASERYGPDDIRVIAPLRMQARAHMQAQDTETALKNHLRALEIVEREGGPTHPQVAIALDGIGHNHYWTGRWDKGLEVYTRAASILEAVHPEGTPNLAWLHVKLAQGHLARGSLGPARSHADTSITMLTALEGDDTDSLSGPWSVIGGIDRLDGHHAAAVEKFEGASARLFGRDGTKQAVIAFVRAGRAAATGGVEVDLAALDRYLDALTPEAKFVRARALAIKARVLASCGQTDAARAALHELEELELPAPLDPAALLDIAIATTRVGDENAGNSAWRSAMQALPKGSDALSSQWPEEVITRVELAENAPADAAPAELAETVTPVADKLEACCRESPWLSRARRFLE